MRKFFLILLILSLGIGSCKAQIFRKSVSRNVERGLYGKSAGSRKKAKVKEPRYVLKARKKQEAKDRKLKREYEESVERSRERTLEIQTPEVQARMKKDRKDNASRDRAKKKKIKVSSKKAGGKYK